MDNVEFNSVERLIGELEIEQTKRYSHEQLQTFTSDFSTNIGSGAYGTVYKGILDNGVKVAVKVLGHNELSDDQFKAEVSTLCKTHHKNLVKLYGFCFARNMKALVYEFVENGSLEKILYESETITWETLCSILIGTAKGLSYLHEFCDPRIIHYDIKPSNILLDSNFSSKIGDFGLAKLITRDKTHITMSKFRGTPYFGAPEIFVGSSSATYKSDVYSYGITLFEILGRRIRERSFPNQVWEKFKKGQLEDFLKNCGIEEKIMEKAKRISMIALWCVQFVPHDRPSMSDVVRLLEGREEVMIPPDPFWVWNSMSVSSSSMTALNPELKEKEKGQYGSHFEPKTVPPPLPNENEWEIDPSELDFSNSAMIGKGSFGEILKAGWGGTPVAVKCILPSLSDDRLVVQDFRHEVKLLMQLRHPNIVQFIGAVTERKPLMLITEYLRGGDLHQHLKEKGSLNPAAAINFALDIARGMTYLHNEPNVIIHRDLKPRNVLLVNTSADHLKVGDFGLSKLIRVQNCDDVYKLTGETGSYRYMAPEVFKHRKYDKKVDVFSFAMILYEMLEGAPPMSNYEPYEAAKYVADGHRPIFRSKGYIPELRTLTEQCWAADMNQRPSFSEILKKLEKIKGTLPTDHHWNLFTRKSYKPRRGFNM